MPDVFVSSASTIEGSDGFDRNYLVWTVSLSEPAAVRTDVDYRFLSGSGIVSRSTVVGADGYGVSNSVIFNPGDTSREVRFRIDADAVPESDEAVVIELHSPSAGARLDGGGQVLRSTGWIRDDDGTNNKLALFVSDPVVEEGNSGKRTAVFEIQLSRPAPNDLTIDYRTVGGTARPGEDFEGKRGSVTFLPGQDTKTVEVKILGDRKLETNEAFSLLVETPTGVAQSTAGLAVIVDDDASARQGLPTVSVDSNPVLESSDGFDRSYLEFAISLSEPATSDVRVYYRLLPGTGETARGDGLGVDAYDTPSYALFRAGETSKNVIVRINDNSEVEADETILLEIQDITGPAVLAGDAPALREAGWILDDDGASDKIALYSAPVVLREGNKGKKSVDIEIELSRPATQDLEIDYRTVSGTALSGQDFVGEKGVVRFREGQQSSAIRLEIKGDKDLEEAENFSVVFDTPNNVTNAAAAEIRILDDDAGAKQGVPTVSTEGYRVFEGSTGFDRNYLKWTIALSDPATSQVRVSYNFVSGSGEYQFSATQGVDAYGGQSSVYFNPGETSKQVLLRINDDIDPESDENVVMEVSNVTGAAKLAGDVSKQSATSWILDDDGTSNKLALAVSNPIVNEGGGGTKQVTFDVELSRPAPRDFEISYRTASETAKAGKDFNGKKGVLKFYEGQTHASVTVTVRGDRREESAEKFALVIEKSGPVTRNAIGEATILDGWIRGTNDGDRLEGGSFADAMTGLGGGDRLFGRDGKDYMLGGSGNDRMEGGGGNDFLKGGSGKDRIDGGTGTDRMTGGNGKDIFEFNSEKDSPAGKSRDVIADFKRGVDRIDLSDIDAKASSKRDDKFKFIGTRDFNDKAGELRVKKGVVYADTDGDGRADFALTVQGLKNLGADDFIL